MKNKWDLQREVGSLEMLISALSNDLVKEKSGSESNNDAAVLLKEMEEALCELRQTRGLKKVLLVAMTAAAARPVPGRRSKRRLYH